MQEKAKMKIPILDLSVQHNKIAGEIRAAVDRVMSSQQFILGRTVEQFEEAVRDFTGCAHAVGMSSGTDAQLAILMAMGIGPGDEVIVPTLTFCATANVVVHLGARPVLVDVGEDFNLTCDSIRAAISERTRAIMPVHFAGQACDLNSIYKIAERFQLAVVEDAAHVLAEDADRQQLHAAEEHHAAHQRRPAGHVVAVDAPKLLGNGNVTWPEANCAAFLKAVNAYNVAA
jgi:dTDP-4-amino-4,6-dideoxygalactose transaminase